MEPIDRTAAEPPGHWQRRGKQNQHRRARRPFRERLNPAIPLLIGIFCCVMNVVIDIFGAGRFARRPIPLDQELLRYPVYFGVGFIGFYLLQLLEPVSMDPRTMICNQCHRVKNEDREPNCSCGGQFEPLDNWEWAEEDHPNTEANANTEE